VQFAEPRHDRQHHVHGGFVGAHEDPPPPQVAQLAHRGIGLLRQAHQPLGVVEQHPARLGEPAILGRPVEQLLAELLLEPAHGLAHRRLRPPQPRGGLREAALAATVRNTCSSARSIAPLSHTRVPTFN
jgi:hypothetical protein